MILELTQTTFRPRTTEQVTSAYEGALDERVGLSPLAGFFFVEIGRLNTTVELWPYQDEAERDRVKKAASSLESWPPRLKDVQLDQETLVLEAAPFNPPLTPARYGPVYEIRTYELAPGTVKDQIAGWGEQIAARAAVSPFVGAFFSDSGGEANDVWVHIWAYNSAEQRQELRAAAQSQGIWPPRRSAPIVAMSNQLVLPAHFSPLQ